jgi:DNA (cytosine-5)-methyltransferase 1
MVALTTTGGGTFIRAADKSYLSDGDFRNIATFPQDYDFCGNPPQYVCGMSVPPNMMANIATQIWHQWLKK